MIFLILFLLLTLFNAYFSAIEIAMVSVRPFRIHQAANEGNAAAKKLLEILKTPDEYLSAIQVGITLIAIVEGLYGGEAFQRYLEPLFLGWGWPMWLAHGVSVFIGVGGITYFSILLGELLPKTLALQTPQKVALRFSPSLWYFTRLFYPIVQLLTSGTHMLLRVFSPKSSENQKLTDADLMAVLSLAYRQGTLQERELKLHENLFSFYDLRATQIMTPLSKIVEINESMTSDEISPIVKASPHIFFPVVRQDRSFVGVLSAKDFLVNPNTPLAQMVRQAAKVKQDSWASEVLTALQSASTTFAVIVDNADKPVGIVTMHDVGEALVGKFA
jgi:putative hemolysin